MTFLDVSNRHWDVWMKLPTAGLGETVQEARADSWGSGDGCMHCMVRLWKWFVWSGEET